MPVGSTAQRPGSPIEGMFRSTIAPIEPLKGIRMTKTLLHCSGVLLLVQVVQVEFQHNLLIDTVLIILKVLYFLLMVQMLSGHRLAQMVGRLQRIWTHGYVGGGYKSGAPWRNVNRTVHSTDTSTNLGDTLDRSGAYMAGSFSDNRHWFHSMENTYRGSSNYTSGFSMTTEAGITHQNAWDMTVNRGSMGSFQDHEHGGGYSYLIGGGNARTDSMNLKTEVMRTSGFPPNHADGGDDPTHGGNARLKGWYKRSGTRQGFVWRTETWVTWDNGPGGDGWKKILGSMLGHMYVGTGNNNQNGNQRVDDTTGLQTRGLNFGNMGEENFEMGMRKGYCLGNYNGSQNNNTFK